MPFLSEIKVGFTYLQWMKSIWVFFLLWLWLISIIPIIRFPQWQASISLHVYGKDFGVWELLLVLVPLTLTFSHCCLWALQRWTLSTLLLLFLLLVAVQHLSHNWLFQSSWTAALQASLSLIIFWSLPKFIPLESVMPSNHLILCHPLLFLLSIFPSLRVISNESDFPIRWSKYWSFSFSNRQQSFQRVFRVDFLWDWLVWSPCYLRDFQDSSPASQFESINSLMLCLLYSLTFT